MIRRFVFSLFAFAVLSSFGADPIYYAGLDSVGDFSGYAWVPSFADVVSALHPDFVPSDWNPNLFVDPNDPYSNYLVPISPDVYFESQDDSPYRPFSSDPAYASSIPSSPPSGGGSGGSGSGGGEGEGGFDPVGSFGGLSSLMSGLASVAVGLFAIASGILLTFLVFRKVRYSSKRI